MKEQGIWPDALSFFLSGLFTCAKRWHILGPAIIWTTRKLFQGFLMPRNIEDDADNRLTGTSKHRTRVCAAPAEIAAHNRGGSPAARTSRPAPGCRSHRAPHVEMPREREHGAQNSTAIAIFSASMLFELVASPRRRASTCARSAIPRLPASPTRRATPVFLRSAAACTRCVSTVAKVRSRSDVHARGRHARRHLGVAPAALRSLGAPGRGHQQYRRREQLPPARYGMNGRALLHAGERSQKLGYAMREMPGLAGVRRLDRRCRTMAASRLPRSRSRLFRAG